MIDNQNQNNQGLDGQGMNGGQESSLMNELEGLDPVIANAHVDLDGGEGDTGSNVGGQPDPITGLPKEGVRKKENAFADADEEARKFQSLFNKTENELKTVKSELDKYKGKASLLDMYITNPKIRKAMIRKFEPDLLKKPDPGSFVDSKLKEEFGEDYRENFKSEEINIPGTYSWNVNMRSMNLYQQATTEEEVPQTVEQIIAEMEEQTQNQQTQFEQQKRQIAQKYNWNESKTKNFLQWMGKLSMDDLAYTYEKGSKGLNPNSLTPNLSEIEGNSRGQMHPEQKKLFETFGAPEQSFGPSILR